MIFIFLGPPGAGKGSPESLHFEKPRGLRMRRADFGLEQNDRSFALQGKNYLLKNPEKL